MNGQKIAMSANYGVRLLEMKEAKYRFFAKNTKQASYDTSKALKYPNSRLSYT